MSMLESKMQKDKYIQNEVYHLSMSGHMYSNSHSEVRLPAGGSLAASRLGVHRPTLPVAQQGVSRFHSKHSHSNTIHEMVLPSQKHIYLKTNVWLPTVLCRVMFLCSGHGLFYSIFSQTSSGMFAARERAGCTAEIKWEIMGNLRHSNQIIFYLSSLFVVCKKTKIDSFFQQSNIAKGNQRQSGS